MRTILRRLRTAVLLVILVLATTSGRLAAQIGEVAYSFTAQEGGGVATAQVDTKTGKIVGQRVLFQANDCTTPNKVRRSADGQTIVVNNETEDGPHLFLISLRNRQAVRRVQLGSAPDEVRIAGNHALVTCADDAVALVDLGNGKLISTWKADKALSPPANAPEDIFVLPGQDYAVVSFQKDSKTGKKKGSRLALLKVPQMQPVADVPLKRTHPELHIDGNLKEQGPSPEIVLVSEEVDTLLATLDLYGAVLVMDWSGFKVGKLMNWKYLPTSGDDSWGSAFPDRASLFPLGTHPVVLVCNAGPDGGAVLVHLKSRQIVRKWPVPPGLEKPVFLPRLEQAFSVCSGKTKRRGVAELDKTYHPGKSIYTFDFSTGPEGRRFSMEAFPTDLYLIRLAAVSADRSPLLVLAAGTGPDKADTLLTFDPTRKQIVDQRPAAGDIGQFEG